MTQSPLIFRKGLDLKHEVAQVLADSYHSELVAAIKESDYRFESGRLTLYLAREFGFCYGVDRAVDYAYQTRKRFPDRTVYLTGEIIHNPHVNDQTRAQGIRFLSDPGESFDALDGGRTSSSCRRSASRSNCSSRSSRSRLHAGRHDVRFGVERLEERQTVFRGRLYVDHPRQATGTKRRAPPRRRRTGRAWSFPCRPRPAEAELVCDYISARRGSRRVLETFGRRNLPRLRSRRPPRPHRLREPDDDVELGVARNRGDVPARDAPTATARPALRPVPRLRHDLQRHPGPSGCDSSLLDERRST